MAKFARVGYGSHGQGMGTQPEGYTYVVNDNVRTGDKIQVISTATHRDKSTGELKRGRKFATTAVPHHVYGERTKKGQEAKQDAESAVGEVTRSFTGKELGVTGSTYGQNYMDKKNGYYVGKGHTPPTDYDMATRAGNIYLYSQTHPDAKFSNRSQETFETYSKDFMGKGDNE